MCCGEAGNGQPGERVSEVRSGEQGDQLRAEDDGGSAANEYAKRRGDGLQNVDGIARERRLRERRKEKYGSEHDDRQDDRLREHAHRRERAELHRMRGWQTRARAQTATRDRTRGKRRGHRCKWPRGIPEQGFAASHALCPRELAPNASFRTPSGARGSDSDRRHRLGPRRKSPACSSVSATTTAGRKKIGLHGGACVTVDRVHGFLRRLHAKW